MSNENENKLPTAWDIEEIYTRWERIGVDEERFKNWRWIEMDLKYIQPTSNECI